MRDKKARFLRCRGGLWISLLIFLMGVVGTSATPAGAAEVMEGKVGYINLNRLVRESNMGQKARADLLRMRENKEKEIERQGQILKGLREELNKRGDEMGDSEKKEKTELLQKVYRDYQRLVADAKEDIAREDRDLVAMILKAADSILKDVAKARKFSIILKDPNAIGYLDPKVDITDDILKQLNRKN